MTDANLPASPRLSDRSCRSGSAARGAEGRRGPASALGSRATSVASTPRCAPDAAPSTSHRRRRASGRARHGRAARRRARPTHRRARPSPRRPPDRARLPTTASGPERLAQGHLQRRPPGLIGDTRQSGPAPKRAGRMPKGEPGGSAPTHRGTHPSRAPYASPTHLEAPWRQRSPAGSGNDGTPSAGSRMGGRWEADRYSYPLARRCFVGTIER
jgi:hypothetical protein